MNLHEELKDKSDEIVLRASVHAPSAFEHIVDRYQHAFLRKASSVIHDNEAAADIVQDTFVKIYKNAARFKHQEGASFKSWAYRILMNTAITAYNKMKLSRESVISIEQGKYENMARSDARTEERISASEQITNAITRVPEQFARVLEAYYLRDKPQKTIAEEEGVTTDTIKMRLFRARKELKSILSNDYV